jgi:hypothetical protein
MDKTQKMNSNKFREDLQKIMPKYKWTIKRGISLSRFEAIGIQSSGKNRLSTLCVVRIENDNRIKYIVKSSGYGRHADWLHTHEDETLAKALRGLQNHYANIASLYENHLEALQKGRGLKVENLIEIKEK